MSEKPLHDFMLPRLHQLVQQAEAAGFARDPAVAVIMDIIMQPTFNSSGLPPEPLPAEPAIAVPRVGEEHGAPSLGNTEWIKPHGIIGGR